MSNKKRIFLFGATGIIGSDFSEVLNKNDFRLVLADHPKSNVKKLSKKLGCEYVEIDALDKKNFVKKISSANKFFDGFDCGIFNIAITSEYLKKKYKKPFPNFIDYPIKMWEETIDVNLTACFLFAREMAKILKENKEGGSLINISSIYGVVAPDKKMYKNENFDSIPGYSASKSGVIGLTKWLASYLSEYKINVNSISPGGVRNQQSKKFIEKYNQKTILGRMAESNEISGLLLFLISNEAKYITGQNFVVDGGFTSI